MNKAIITNGNKLSFKNLQKPSFTGLALQTNNILVKQQAFGLNYDDIKVKNGFITNPNTHGILGIEAAGVIEAISPVCKRGFKVGDRVCYATFRPGAFVEHRIVNENYLMIMPRYASFEMGATLLKGLAAYSLFSKVFIIPKDSVIVITGISGGIGTILSQIAFKAGLKIIGITRSEEKRSYIKSNGADLIINYKSEDVAKKVMDFTKGKGADFFFDCVGKESESFAFDSLKTTGFFISFGNITGEYSKINLSTQKQKSITTTRFLLSNYLTSHDDFITMSIAYLKSIQVGIVSPKITTYDFSEASEVLSKMEKGILKGQQVLLLQQ
jgi:NADPH2:quinone reductase